MVKHARRVTSVPRITLALGVSATLAAGLVAAPAGVGVTSPFISAAAAEEAGTVDLKPENITSTLKYKNSGEDFFAKWTDVKYPSSAYIGKFNSEVSKENSLNLELTINVPRNAKISPHTLCIHNFKPTITGEINAITSDDTLVAKIKLDDSECSEITIENKVNQEKAATFRIPLIPYELPTAHTTPDKENAEKDYPETYSYEVYGSMNSDSGRTTVHKSRTYTAMYKKKYEKSRNGTTDDYSRIAAYTRAPSIDTGTATVSVSFDRGGNLSVRDIFKEDYRHTYYYARMENRLVAKKRGGSTYTVSYNGPVDFQLPMGKKNGTLDEIEEYVDRVAKYAGGFERYERSTGERITSGYGYPSIAQHGKDKTDILKNIGYEFKTETSENNSYLTLILTNVPNSVTVEMKPIMGITKYVPNKKYKATYSYKDSRGKEAGFWNVAGSYFLSDNVQDIVMDSFGADGKIEYIRKLTAKGLINGKEADTKEKAGYVQNGEGEFTIKVTNTGEIGTRSLTIQYPQGLKDDQGRTSKTFEFEDKGFPVGTTKEFNLGTLRGIKEGTNSHTFTITSPYFDNVQATVWTTTEKPINFSYPPIKTNSGGTTTIKPTITDTRTNDATTLPPGTSFTPSNDCAKWITVNPTTGEVTAKPPVTQPKGDNKCTVTVKMPNSPDKNIPIIVTVDADYHVTGTTVDQNGNPVIKTNIADDGKLKEYTLKLPNGAKNITRDGDNIVIEWNDPSRPKTVIRYKDGGDKETTVRVTGTGKDRNVVFTVDGKDVTLPVADLYVEKVTRGADGNYTVTLNDTTKKWDINVGSDLATMKKKIEQEIGNLAADSATIENTLRTEMTRVYDEHTKERTNKLNEYITAVNKFGEEVKKKDKEFNANADKTDKKLTTLEQCVNSPAIALPALVATVSTIAATVQSLGLPNVFTGQLDPFENNPEIQQARKFLNDNQQLIAAGLGVLGIIGVLLIPGLCNSGALGERMVNGDAAEKPDSTVLGSSDNTSRETETEEVKNDTDNADNGTNK